MDLFMLKKNNEGCAYFNHLFLLILLLHLFSLLCKHLVENSRYQHITFSRVYTCS